MIADNASTLVYLDDKNPSVDVEGKVPGPGQYVLVVHYYQPDHPGNFYLIQASSVSLNLILSIV